MRHRRSIRAVFRCVTLLCLALASRPRPGAAGEDERPARIEAPPDLEEGARVRVSTSTVGRRVGVVQAITADALVLRLEGAALPWTVPYVDLTRVETSHGPRGRAQGAWRKAKWGALIGAVPGAIALAVQHEQVGDGGSSVSGAMALGAWSGGLAGGLVGAALGAIHPGERWEEVSPSFRIHPAPGGGLSLSVTVGF